MTSADGMVRGDDPRRFKLPTLTDAVAGALRERIISGEIMAGTRLTEVGVAETFSVARPTAKAGLERLVSQGLLRRGAHMSAMVPILTAADVTDIYLGREVVEVRVVELLAKTGRVPRAAARALRAMEQAADDGEFLEHVEADIEFHRALVASIGSPRMRLMHETVMGESQLCIAQVQARERADLAGIARSHGAILEAIRAADLDGARSALLADLARARDSLLSDLGVAIGSASA